MNPSSTLPELPDPTPARTAGKSRHILEARARVLAQAPLPAQEEVKVLQVLEFTLSRERFAIESDFIRQVAVLENLTPLPCTPDFVLGIVNLHGETLPLIELRSLFGMPARGLTDLNRIIVLQSEATMFCILADAIAGLRGIPRAAIHPAPSTLSGTHRDCLMGVAPGPVAVLDAQRIINDKNIMVEEYVDG